MLKTINRILKQDKEKYRIPRRVQDLIPIKCIWNDGIFRVGNKFTKSFRFTDINYYVASREDKENMLNQAASDREKLGKLLNISPEQMSYVTNSD